MEPVTTRLVDWAKASRPITPGQVSGDLCLVREAAQGVLIAVVDGLGHGPDAASAAQRAVALLGGGGLDRPIEVVQRCHAGLKGSRGVVLSLAWFDSVMDTMTWIGVGNVAGVLVRFDPGSSPRQEWLRSGRGVVGRQIPPLRAEILSVGHGDMLVLATDGVRPDFAHDLSPAHGLQLTADRILAGHAAATDDALAVVARYRGAAA